ERPSEAQPTPSPAPTSEVPNEPQTDSSLAPTSEVPNEPQPDSTPTQTSEVPIEQQTDLSLRPSPTPFIPDSIPKTSGGNLGGHSSSDKSLSGNESDITLQSVYDLCLSLCAQGRKFAKGESSFQRDPLFDELDHMETENAQDVGRTRDIVGEEKENDEDVLCTNKDKVSTDRPKVSTDRQIERTDEQKVSTDEQKVSTDEQIE
ncbi:hypothetical protein Tco_0175893, partial [Tanacetum coccineum]